MIEQLKTIREKAEFLCYQADSTFMRESGQTILTALAQIEAAVGEPVAFVTDADVACFGKGAQGEIAALLHRQGKWCHPLFTGTPVAQQPQAEAVPSGFVLVPIDVLEAASESLGSFVSDNGWTDLDMQAMDNLDAIIAQQKGGV